MIESEKRRRIAEVMCPRCGAFAKVVAEPRGEVMLAKTQCNACRLDMFSGITTAKALEAWRSLPLLEEAYESARTPAERGRLMGLIRKAREAKETGDLGIWN